MVAWKISLLTLTTLINAIWAAPLESRSVTTLSAATISSFTPYTYFAGVGNCPPAVTKAWNCGAACNALPGFKTVQSGGDGTNSQFWFVGYYPALDSVIVAHQGTDVKKIVPVLNDAAIIRQKLDSTLFPGVPSSVAVHAGFKEAHADSATAVLAAVKTAMSTYNTVKVTIVGHSLGGAISLLDSIYLPLHLPSTTIFKTVLYGLPRVGEQDFANYVDAHVKDLVRIDNKDDPVPILPGRFLGFKHPSGEIHIKSDGSWVSCSGQDNESSGCTVKDVGNIFIANGDDHSGPYNGITIRCG
jgi:hypothetical protein